MKKLFLTVAVMLAAMASQAAYLLWQVDTTTANTWGASSAGLWASNGSTSTMISGTTAFDTQKAVDLSSLAGSPSSYSFYIELMNSSGAVVGHSDTAKYSELAANITTDVLDFETVEVWHGGTYSVPEPTSGVLMLIGLAGLALKRRKA